MYKRMLVPLDGSELAETVLHYAAEIGGRLGLEIVLLHVANPDQPELLPIVQAYIDHVAETIGRQSAKVQGKAEVKKHISVRGEVLAGYPADTILRYAEDNNINLILIASHGRSGIRRWVLGSVADKVLRTSKVPVWLVRARAERILHARWLLERVLVPLDGSPLAELIFPHIETLAKQRDTGTVNVTLLRVWEPLVIPTASTPESQLDWAKLIEEHISKAREAAGQYLADAGERLIKIGLKVNSELVVGEPADEITNYASRNHFSLIAIASHGHSGITRWAYGNTADKVLHGASVPVLLVRPQ